MTAIAVLLGHHWRRHRLPLLPMMAGVALFEFLLTRMAPAPNEVSWISQMMAAVPPQLLSVVGREIGFATPGGFLAIGYGHPFILLILSVWSVRLSSAALAGEIGRGTMDLIAARPISRWQHVAAAIVALAAGVSLLTFAAWGGTAFGLSLRDLGVSASRFAEVSASLWLLFFTWGAIALAISALQREGGVAIGWSSGLIATSFVLEYIARVWQPMHAFRPLSLFAYYDPQQVARLGLQMRDASVLGLVATTAIGVAAVMFQRRDL